MKDVLPKAEARKLRKAREYLNDEQLKRYKDALVSFYGPDPCYGVIDPILRLFMPKDSPAAKDLAMKRHQVLVMDSDRDIRDRMGLMENASDVIKSSLANDIELLSRSKEFYRQKAIQEYGVEIPG